MKTLSFIAIVIAIVAFLVGGLGWLILTGYRLTWTGFSTKMLWDWMQILLVPLMLAIGGFWLNKNQKDRDERATEQRGEIAADNQREAALQAYLDKMSELLLEKKLRDSAEEEETRKIARVRTLTVLRGLDPIRKASVIQFLHEPGLIDKDKCIISLSKANLSGAILSKADLSEADLREADLREANLFRAYLSFANLSKANLWRADLREANLSGADLGRAYLGRATLRDANLSGADLSGADLSEAKLSGAKLSGADLSGADLSGADLSDAKVTEAQLKTAQSLKGATMPDGSKHP